MGVTESTIRLSELEPGTEVRSGSLPTSSPATTTCVADPRTINARTRKNWTDRYEALQDQGNSDLKKFRPKEISLTNSGF